MNMTLWYRGTDDRNEEGQESHAKKKKKGKSCRYKEKENQKIWGKLRTFIGFRL